MDPDGRKSCQTGRDDLPRHVAIIMDGNGRWAEKRGLPRSAGHKQGVETVRRIVRAAGELGVEYLTLYSFSSENWSRPQAEISELFSLLRMFIRKDLADLHKNNVRVRIIGNRDGVPDDICVLLDEAESLTEQNSGQTLVVAFNYGSRSEIVGAARLFAEQVAAGKLSPAAINESLFSSLLDTRDIPDPDLLIRTSGEIRLSNFLLWQLAYAEMLFVDCLWPDFSQEELEKALQTYATRTRKFGGLAVETGS